MNWCHECLVDSLGTITESQIRRLGSTQQGFFGLASQLAEMRGLTGNELKSFLLTTLKRNAGEMDADDSDSTSFSLPSNLTVKPLPEDVIILFELVREQDDKALTAECCYLILHDYYPHEEYWPALLPVQRVGAGAAMESSKNLKAAQFAVTFLQTAANLDKFGAPESVRRQARLAHLPTAEEIEAMEAVYPTVSPSFSAGDKAEIEMFPRLPLAVRKLKFDFLDEESLAAREFFEALESSEDSSVDADTSSTETPSESAQPQPAESETESQTSEPTEQEAKLKAAEAIASIEKLLEDYVYLTARAKQAKAQIEQLLQEAKQIQQRQTDSDDLRVPSFLEQAQGILADCISYKEIKTLTGILGGSCQLHFHRMDVILPVGVMTKPLKSMKWTAFAKSRRSRGILVRSGQLHFHRMGVISLVVVPMAPLKSMKWAVSVKSRPSQGILYCQLHFHRMGVIWQVGVRI